MKQIMVFLLAIVSAAAIAQSPTVETMEIKDPEPVTVEFNGANYNGYMVEFNSSADIVEQEVREKFKSQGVKPKKSDGFLVYRGVLLTQIDSRKQMDAFIKIEKNSKKESDKCTVYFIAAYPGQIPEDKVKPGETAAPAGVTAAVTGSMVLKGLSPGVEQRTWEKNLFVQQEAVKKEEKKLEQLKNTQLEIENKILQLQTALTANAQAQTTQTEIIAKAKSDLEAVIAKRPGGSDKN